MVAIPVALVVVKVLSVLSSCQGNHLIGLQQGAGWRRSEVFTIRVEMDKVLAVVFEVTKIVAMSSDETD